MRKPILIIFLLVAVGLIGISFMFCHIKNDLDQTGKLIAEFKSEFSKLEGLTPQAEKILCDFDRITGGVKLLAQIKIAYGYDAVEKIIGNLAYQEETENTFEKAYEALGCMSRFDERALKLLLSEFNPKADSVRAMNVLVGMKLTGDSLLLAQCIKEIKPFMSEENIDVRLGDKSVSGRGKIAVLK